MRKPVAFLKNIAKRIPVVRALARSVYAAVLAKKFPGSERYWIERYAGGGDSGAGSYHELAEFKADVLNRLVQEMEIESVIEYGCGDGNQLRLARYPGYIGFDVSADAISRCQAVFAGDGTKTFKPMKDYAGETAELVLSLDVIYHLVEDDVFASHMSRLFASSTRFVVIYSSDTDEQAGLQAPHVRHRNFTRWIEAKAPDWRLIGRIPNPHRDTDRFTQGHGADFFIYERHDVPGS